MTAEDYDVLPETGPRYQLIEGDLLLLPGPNRYHQEISLNLSYLLMKYLEKNPRGRTYHAPLSVYLDSRNVFQPDILFVSNERRSILADDEIKGAPDFIAEILSPQTAPMDRGQKREIYFAHDVREFWLIDPLLRQIDVYLLEEDAASPSALYGENDVFESAFFPGLKFEAAAIFAQ